MANEIDYGVLGRGGSTILVDMDGVLCDYQGEFNRRWQEKYPGREFVSPENQIHFKVNENYPEAYADDISKIICEPDFFPSLAPLPGAVEGIRTLMENNDVYICTSPSLQNPNCATGKMEWVGKHLGEDLQKRTIISKYKTMVFGDYLIDDKPVIRPAPGAQLGDYPWEHILYDQNYNRAALNFATHKFDWLSGLEEIAAKELCHS